MLCEDKRKVVYICHPFSGDIAANQAKVRRICMAIKRGFVPIAPHLMLPEYFDEATEREEALQHCLTLIRIVDEVWVCSRNVTEGMKAEIEEAKKHLKTIIKMCD